MLTLPALHTGNKSLDTAFRIAFGDIAGNIAPFMGELSDAPAPCLLAGLTYTRPWTRDAAFNTWYGAGLLAPTIAKNTLRAVLIEDAHGLRIGGQYWDAVVWSLGAWAYYLYTGDKVFLAEALEATTNALRYAEITEFDPDDGLFRGGACFMDGVGGYPDRYTNSDFDSEILAWPRNHLGEAIATGGGLPMKALSTNCLYFQAYELAARMAAELECASDSSWNEKRVALGEAIRTRFWRADAGVFRYLVDAYGGCDQQEGLGHAFAILFGIATPEQTTAILKNLHTTPHGVSCLWPSFDRYVGDSGAEYGRHAGTVWPQVNAAWVAAALSAGRADVAWNELSLLAEKACRDNQFVEIYHPETGLPYGGLQENLESGQIISWEACPRQTWCATGYVYMVLSILLGLRFDTAGISFAPYLPEGIDAVQLTGLSYRNATLDIAIRRGVSPSFSVNSIAQSKTSLDKNAEGHVVIDMVVAEKITP